MLTTLASHGMVEFDQETQLWSVGVETYRIGSAFLRRRKLVDRARAVMQELMETTGETANLGVAEDDCVVFVSQVETHQAIRAFFRPGTRSPFHASGIGKAILSPSASERIGAIVRKAGLMAYTAKTLSDHAALARDLAESQARGFAVDDEERNEGMRCVAAAIFNEFGEPMAGISVSGPTVPGHAGARRGIRPAGARSGSGGDKGDRRLGGLLIAFRSERRALRDLEHVEQDCRPYSHEGQDQADHEEAHRAIMHRTPQRLVTRSRSARDFICSAMPRMIGATATRWLCCQGSGSTPIASGSPAKTPRLSRRR